MHSWYDSLGEGSARRKATTYTQNIRTQAFTPRVGIETTIPVFERGKIVHALDRAANVTSESSTYHMTTSPR
jgi:hypothetical protein